MGEAPLNAVLPYITAHLTYFYPCGTNSPLRFCRRRGIVWRVGSICTNQGTLIWWISVHQINIKAREDFITVNRLSEIQRSRLNRTFDGSLWNTWLHVDSPMRIRRCTLRRRWARVMRTCPLIACNVNASQLSNHPSANGTTHVFCKDFFYKNNVLSL